MPMPVPSSPDPLPTRFDDLPPAEQARRITATELAAVHAQGEDGVQLPATFAVLERYGAEIEQIRAQRFAADKERDLLTAAQARATAALAAAIDRDAEAAVRDLAQQRARLQAEARGQATTGPPPFETERELLLALRAEQRAARAEARAHALARVLETSDDLEALVEAVEEAVAREDDWAVRLLGATAQARLRTLARLEGRKAATETAPRPAFAALRQVETALQAWRQAHPTPREQIAAISRRLAARQAHVQHAAAQIASVYGLARPSAGETAAAAIRARSDDPAPTRGAIVYGAAFQAPRPTRRAARSTPSSSS